jgi:hypothetical protein
MLKIVRIFKYTFCDTTREYPISLKDFATELNLNLDNLMETIKTLKGQAFNSNKYITITFKNLDRAKIAKEWFESLLMLNTLTKEG